MIELDFLGLRSLRPGKGQRMGLQKGHELTKLVLVSWIPHVFDFTSLFSSRRSVCKRDLSNRCVLVFFDMFLGGCLLAGKSDHYFCVGCKIAVLCGRDSRGVE